MKATLQFLFIVGCERQREVVPRDEPSTMEVSSSSPILCRTPRSVPFEATRTGAQHDSAHAELVGAGIGVEDYDDDGFLDLFLPSVQATDARMFWGDDGAFVEDDASGWAPLDASAAVSHADYDSDGDLDLFVARWEQPSVLLRNEGGRQFVDATAESGLGRHAVKAQTAPWADIDGDGDLDLFIGAYGERAVIITDGSCDDHVPDAHPGQLWRNNGDGTFTDASDHLPDELDGQQDVALEQWDAYVFMAAFYDLDGDHRPELLVSNDDGLCQGSLALANRDGGFEVGGARGWDGDRHDMGMASADLNGDELPDFAITSYQNVSYFESADLGDEPVYVDAGLTVGIVDDWASRDRTFGWGTEFGDLDNDADEDLVSVFGFWEYYANDDPKLQPDALFVRGDDGRFSEEAEGWGLADNGVSRSVVLADLDRDGTLDVVKRLLGDAATGGGALVDKTAATKMYLSNCEPSAWITVRLRDERSANGFGVGAKIRAISDRTQVRWVTASSTGMYSARPLEAHFGLADAERVDLEVVWPDGEVLRVDDVATRQVVTLRRKAP
ncbi:MAG: CRTAC1 family protein [Myxococcota bacterium]